MIPEQNGTSNLSLPTYKLSPEEISQPEPQALWGMLAEEDITLQLHVEEEIMLIPLIPDKILWLGRGKSTQPLINTLIIDLTKFDAGQQGVSRHHAALQLENSLLFVTDLGSTNGTWLNGKVLPAHQKRVVRYGDELQLGNLKVKVFFSR